MRLDACDVTTQQVCPRSGRVVRTMAYRRSCIAYCIDESERRVLMIGSDKDAAEYPVAGGVQMLTKFASDGKATLILPKRNTTILIANACPEALQRWCHALKTGGPPPAKAAAAAAEPLSKRALSSPAIGSARRAPLSDLSPSALASTPSVAAAKKARDPGPRPSPTWQSPPVAQGLTQQQTAVLRAACSGRSIFFTGGAGTGKSHLLRQIVTRLPAKTTYVTASTGMAACQVGGVTVHHWAGIGGGDRPVDDLVQMAMRKRGLQWRSATCLVIDEISMLVRAASPSRALPNAVGALRLTTPSAIARRPAAQPHRAAVTVSYTHLTLPTICSV
eukprot:2742022-Prymnesium_polylepis.1